MRSLASLLHARRLAPQVVLGRAALALALGFAGGGLLACFSPPTDDVLFACEPDADDRCPPDYACEADGCCHKIGSDVAASFGACALGGMSGDATAGDTGGTSDTGGSSGTGG